VSHFKEDAFSSSEASAVDLQNCLFLGNTNAFGEATVNNCLFVRGLVKLDASSSLNACTMEGHFGLGREGSTVNGLIVPSIYNPYQEDDHIQRCCLFRSPPYDGKVKPGVACIYAEPQFRDPANLNYRLMPSSPCIGKASDGGDLGCRYTPEMIEMCKIALELRRKGIIKF
jgi:hypothetical protein